MALIVLLGVLWGYLRVSMVLSGGWGYPRVLSGVRDYFCEILGYLCWVIGYFFGVLWFFWWFCGTF